MTYIHLALYDPANSEFVGYVVKDSQANKLKSTNIYPEGSEQNLAVELDRLNTHVAISQHWPHPKDPDVLDLLNDPGFHPIEFEEVDVVDEENSHYAYKQIAGGHTNDPRPGPAWIDSDEVDETASTIVYKKAMVPKRPTDSMQRIRAACEQVARYRAGLLL